MFSRNSITWYSPKKRGMSVFSQRLVQNYSGFRRTIRNMPNVHHGDCTNELWNIPSVAELTESQKTASAASEQVKRHGWASARSCLLKETHTNVST